jgi:predicted 3-demethylubiquinone-9 3-methyltransferase (glyoxalase superfamily)
MTRIAANATSQWKGTPMSNQPSAGETSALPAVTTFLMFEGKAEAAIGWYVSLIENSAILSIERYGPEGPGKEGSVVQAKFSLNGREFMAIDSPVKHQFTFTPAISLFVDCATAGEVDRLFAELSAGGQVLMPLDAYPFSKRFGWLVDKYGVSWQLRLAQGS